MSSKRKATSSSSAPKPKQSRNTRSTAQTRLPTGQPTASSSRSTTNSKTQPEVIVIDSSPMGSPVPLPSTRPPPYSSPPLTPPPILSGSKLWKKDFDDCKAKWKVSGDIEGYAGMLGSIERYRSGDTADSTQFKLVYEDIEGRSGSIVLEIVYNSLESYPNTYETLLYSDSTVSKQAEKTFNRFSKINNLPLPELYSRILASLQGDDESNGGRAAKETQETQEDTDEEEAEYEGDFGEIGGPIAFNTVSSASFTREPDWSNLKLHFEQAKAMGYRPGLTRLDTCSVLSFSIPLKNLPIDPNTLAIWDDGLVQAWKENKRFAMLIKLQSYPPRPDEMEYFLGFHANYKPSPEEIDQTVRGNGGIPSFYLSGALLGLLKDFARTYKVRTSFAVDWTKADSVAFDPEKARAVFQNGEVPSGHLGNDENDPVSLGYETNVPLCAFWWTIRRFVEANKFCLNCGLEVSVPSLRPYVCDKALCLYGFMSLGLGPSIEHVITHHAAVVDLLLTFAYNSAKSTARMDMPFQLNIEIPSNFSTTAPGAEATGEATLLDNLAGIQQRLAIAWLIERLPKVSDIRSSLVSGKKLHQLGVPPGSIGILRWVVGSCRAYLREAKSGEGILNSATPNPAYPAGIYGVPTGQMRQFTFVVGSPEQEANFKEEVVKAQEAFENCKVHPTLLAYHGSASDRWHNILRTGLDYSETANGRAYGHGIYFASDYQTSMAYTHNRSAAISGIVNGSRPNADFTVNSAIALVELVNVVSTFVSSTPFYVVDKVKQVKPFMLLVSGAPTGEAPETTQQPVDGELFRHDPTLARKTTYMQIGGNGEAVRVRMPRKLVRARYEDEAMDDEEDFKIFHPKGPIILLGPSPPERFAKLQMMPPPTATSTLANRALAKEWTELLKSQEEGDLPFYVNPDNDSLYCWIFELFDFPESQLKKDLASKNIRSVIAEMRFPASFPSEPPFFRILHPRFLPFSQQGGGNITIGGSFCNEGLTATTKEEGWNPMIRIETLVRDVMVNMVCATPPAKLDMRRWDQGYSLYEAIEAYKRVTALHNWALPKDFDKIAL